MVTDASKPVRYPALRHRNFTLIWSGLLVSNMGTWMQNVAQSWLIYQLGNRDPLYLGLLGLSFAIPMIVVPPFGGVVADRVDRIKLLYVTQTCAALLAVILAILTWTNLIRPWHMLAISFLGALLLAFDNPTRQALIPELVPREDVMNALSLNSATYTGAALVGPAISGLLLDVVGAGWLFIGNALTFLAVLGALYAMHDAPRGHRTPTPWGTAVLSGFKYAWEHKVVLALLSLSALSGLFGRSYQQLLPIFADAVWNSGPGGYGTLLSAGGGGALLGAFLMASIREIRGHGRLVLVSGLAFCGALGAFALSASFWPGVVLLVVVGIAATAFSTLIATVIQLRVPGQLRGRVMSLYTVTLIGVPSLGALAVTAAAKALGREDDALWRRAALGVLDVFGIGNRTAEAGAAAGARRALVLCVLVLVAALLLAAPHLRRMQRAGVEHQPEPAKGEPSGG